VYDAYFKMEKIEHAAETLMVARLLGGVRTLDRREVEKLAEARVAYGASGMAFPCGGADCSLAPGSCGGEKTDPGLDRVVEETLRLLGTGGAFLTAKG
jgi:L-fuculose-phosphate aldolase